MSPRKKSTTVIPYSKNRPRHQWLKEALANAGVDRKTLAAQWGITPSLVSRYINFGKPELTLSRARILADLLSTSVDEVFARTQVAEDVSSQDATMQEVTSGTEHVVQVDRDATSVVQQLRQMVQRANAILKPMGIVVDLRIQWSNNHES